MTEEVRKKLCNFITVLQEIYRREEIMWCQRGRSRWLKEGNANQPIFIKW